MAASTTNQAKGNKSTPAFLEKLFDILEDSASYYHMISWERSGTSFIIKKVNEFSEIVLPKYFKHSNIQSCIRQLNMYGFNKTKHDSNHREFTHKLFQRGRRDLLQHIKRKTQTTESDSSKQHTTGTDDSIDDIESKSNGSTSVESSYEGKNSSDLELESRVYSLEQQLKESMDKYTQLSRQYNQLFQAVQNLYTVSNLPFSSLISDPSLAEGNSLVKMVSADPSLSSLSFPSVPVSDTLSSIRDLSALRNFEGAPLAKIISQETTSEFVSLSLKSPIGNEIILNDELLFATDMGLNFLSSSGLKRDRRTRNEAWKDCDKTMGSPDLGGLHAITTAAFMLDETDKGGAEVAGDGDGHGSPTPLPCPKSPRLVSTVKS